MRTIWLHTAALTTMFVAALPVGAQPSAGAAQQPELVRQLAVDDAVELALENNLGIQVERFNPQLADLNIAQALGAWSPMLTSALQGGSTDSPNNSFLSGAQGVKTIDERVTTDFAFEQPLRWGARYSVGWDGSRSTTTNLFSNFSPQLRSSLSLSYQQSLLRGFFIDAPRQQLLVSRVNRDISDIELRQTIAVTSRTVRNAYWELAYAIALLDVQRQSLALAEESLRNTRARVEIGTTPPIDIVESEAEVALREEAVILGEAQIERAEDILRALVYDPNDPDFWTMRIEPAGAPPFDPVVVDLELVTRNALERRADLQQARKTLESNDVTIRFLRNETLPDITAGFDYGLTGLGGTQFIRGAGFPGPVIGSTGRGFGSVLGDVFGNDFPNWTASLNISYPLGSDQSEANLAHARLQQSQALTQLRSQELQVATEVREAARQVITNQKRVDTTRVSRELAERRLDAEERKFTAGTSTSFFVFQAQRDLAQARNNELRAILDHNQSAVDLETVQEAPLTVR